MEVKQDLTAPEHVERLSPIAVAPHDVDPYGAMETDPEGGFVLYEEYAALSAKLEAAEAERDAALGAIDILMDPEAGEIDRKNAMRDARKIRAARQKGT